MAFAAETDPGSRPSLAGARIVHQTPGRVRLHVPVRAAPSSAGVEAALGGLSGVRHVSMNPHTRNVLVLFDPHRLDPSDLLRCLHLQPPSAAAPRCAKHHSVSRRASADRSPASLAGAVEILQRLQSRPTLRNHFRGGLNETLGKGPVDLLLAAAGLVSELLSAGPIGLLLIAIEALFIVAERLTDAGPGRAASRAAIGAIDASLN